MKMESPDYTLLDHTADLGIRVSGTDISHLFENACSTLIELLLDIKYSSSTTLTQVVINGDDLEDLMVRWLGEILYLFEGENTIVISCKITNISKKHLEAELETISFDPLIHEVVREIKAVTYHDIQVDRKNDSWEASIIFDL